MKALQPSAGMPRPDVTPDITAMKFLYHFIFPVTIVTELKEGDQII